MIDTYIKRINDENRQLKDERDVLIGCLENLLVSLEENLLKRQDAGIGSVWRTADIAKGFLEAIKAKESD
jgi:hypothetical protein